MFTVVYSFFREKSWVFDRVTKASKIQSAPVLSTRIRCAFDRVLCGFEGLQGDFWVRSLKSWK